MSIKITNDEFDRVVGFLKNAKPAIECRTKTWRIRLQSSKSSRFIEAQVSLENHTDSKGKPWAFAHLQNEFLEEVENRLFTSLIRKFCPSQKNTAIHWVDKDLLTRFKLSGGDGFERLQKKIAQAYDDGSLHKQSFNKRVNAGLSRLTQFVRMARRDGATDKQISKTVRDVLNESVIERVMNS
jgi:hypothetical protein